MDKNGINMGRNCVNMETMALIWAILHYMGKIVLIWKI